MCRFDTEWKSRGCSNKFLVTHKQVDKLEKKSSNLPNAFFHACRPPRTWKSSGKGLWGQTQSATARRPRYEFNLFQYILKKRIDFYEMSRCIWTAGFYLTVFRWCWVTSTTGRSRRLNVVFETTTMCHRSENLRSSGNNWGLHILESHCPETGATQLIYWSSLELVIAFWNIVSEKCGPPDKNWKFCGQRR